MSKYTAEYVSQDNPFMAGNTTRDMEYNGTPKRINVTDFRD